MSIAQSTRRFVFATMLVATALLVFSLCAAAQQNLVYINANITATNQHVLISRGVRNLPAYKIFTLTNEVMTVVRFGIVDGNSRDGYQAIDIQGTALSLNRPSTVNIISILP